MIGLQHAVPAAVLVCANETLEICRCLLGPSLCAVLMMFVVVTRIHQVGSICRLHDCCRTLRFMYTTVNAAVEMHNRLLQHMLRLPKSFFDTNPAGRILNRFSRDVETMDSVLNQSMVQFANW